MVYKLAGNAHTLLDHLRLDYLASVIIEIYDQRKDQQMGKGRKQKTQKMKNRKNQAKKKAGVKRKISAKKK